MPSTVKRAAAQNSWDKSHTIRLETQALTTRSAILLRFTACTQTATLTLHCVSGEKMCDVMSIKSYITYITNVSSGSIATYFQGQTAAERRGGIYHNNVAE